MNLQQLTQKVMGLANRLGALDSWHLLTLAAGWTNSVCPAQYRYTSDNGVWIVATIVPGTKTDNTTIFTLPTGYRPQDQVCIPVGVQGSTLTFSANTPEAFLAVNTDGTCAIFGVNLGSVSFVHINGTVPLDALN